MTTTDVAGADSLPPAAVRLGRIAIHPVLLAIYPALSLWGVNVREVLPREVWPAIWIPVLVTLALWGLAAAALRDHRRGAAVASVAAVVTLNLGRILADGPAVIAVGIVLAALVLVVVLVQRLRRFGLTATTAVANVLAVVLVVLTLPAVLPRISAVAAPPDRGDGGVAGTATRDIWYLIPDRYPRADTLTEVFGYDNGPFLDSLEARGFQVADQAVAPYPKTAHSLAATLNFAYVPDLVTDRPAGDDWQPLYALLRDHLLGRVLTGAGYDYLHLGTWWSPTATAASATEVRRYDNTSEFFDVWRSQTALPAVLGAPDDDTGSLSLRERNRRYTSFQLDELDRLARRRGDPPKFVMAHITLPHEPYVFDADGALVTQEVASSRTREDNIVRQMRYLNARLDRLLDTLLAGPEETHPIIVIQSDEGPHPVRRVREGTGFDWLAATPLERAEKLRILSAIYLPGVDVTVPDDLNGVNTWRLILSAYLGADLEPLPDRVYVFRNEDHLYDLYDVTAELRR
jgi:hypothetical protein